MMSARTRSKSAANRSRPGSDLSQQDPGIDLSRLYDRPPNSGHRSRPVSSQHVDLDTSRLSAFSHGSSMSAVTLGGKDYPIGSHIGTSGLFVIGDPHYNPPGQDSLNTSQTGLSETSVPSMIITGAQPIQQRGYDFEYWNWPVIRYVCIVVSLVVMVILLTATIVLVVQEKNSCGASAKFTWWRGSSMYMVQVPAFRDSDNDGIGDLMGLAERTDYLEYMGIEAVILTNFLPSNPPEFVGARDFVSVDKRLGNMDDMAAALRHFHNDGIHVLLDMNFVYTSDQHTWFLASEENSASKASKYNGYYVWQESNNPPDNPFANPQWNYNLKRNGYYKHQYDRKDQPLMNWNNQEVRKDIDNVLTQWLRHGVDGFVLRDLQNFDMSSRDRHNNMSSILSDWRDILDSATGSSDDTQKVLVVESTYLDIIKKDAPEVLASLMDKLQLVEAELTVDWGNDLTNSLPRQVENNLQWQNHPSGPWVLWRMQPYPKNDEERWQVSAIQLYMGMLPGNPCFQMGHEVGKNYEESDLNQNDMIPLLWQATTSRPYSPGSQMNDVTVEALRSLLLERRTSYALRSDAEAQPYQGEDKEFNLKTLYNVNEDGVLLVERFYYREDKYYYVANLGRSEIEKDFSMLVTQGSVVSDSKGENSGDFKVHRLEMVGGQAVVFYVKI